MDDTLAKLLIENLIGRIESRESGGRQLSGVLTDHEIEALNWAKERLTVARSGAPATTEKILDGSSGNVSSTPSLDWSVLELTSAPEDVRVCIDFGTATSKATLVRDEPETGEEEIEVLELGVPGDQEEISPIMLISSVYVDEDERVWFGKAAIDLSLRAATDTSHRRIDNIKRRLSEGGLDDPIEGLLHEQERTVTYSHLVLAYLGFLTWTAIQCTSEMGYARNLKRRFAMPCLHGEKSRIVRQRLSQLLGQAQILADNIGNQFTSGVNLSELMDAIQEVERNRVEYTFIGENITEPLGVAGSLVSWRSAVNMLAMVIDVGAGTSDLSLYRIKVDPDDEEHTAAYEVDGTVHTITEAGNYLDNLLIQLVLRQAGIDSAHPMWSNIFGALNLEIRDHKETLFNEESVIVPLMDGSEVEVKLEEFLELDAVRQFGEELLRLA